MDDIELLGELSQAIVKFDRPGLRVQLQIDVDLSGRSDVIQRLSQLKGEEEEVTPVVVQIKAFLDAAKTGPKSEPDDKEMRPAVPTVTREGVFHYAGHTYEGTDVPLYTIRANMTKDELAEAAFQHELPECMIRMTKRIRRGDSFIEQTQEYHWKGDSIEWITSAKKAAWIRNHQANREQGEKAS